MGQRRCDSQQVGDIVFVLAVNVARFHERPVWDKLIVAGVCVVDFLWPFCIRTDSAGRDSGERGRARTSIG